MTATRLTPLRQVFGIDLRSLALFRIALGLLLISDLWARSRVMTAFYTDQGLLPRNAVLEYWGFEITNSLHLASGSYYWALLLFSVSFLSAFCIVVGYRTRIALVVSFVLLTSMQIRNFAALQGSDDLMRGLLMWAIFLPCAARYSVDAAMDRGDPEAANLRSSDNFFSFATIALLCQAMFVYFVGAMLKTEGTVWVPDFDAVYYAQHIDQFATYLSQFIRDVPEITTPLTVFVWLLELLGPILLFAPIFTTRIRIVVLVLLFFMHLGFAMFLQVGLFPYASVTSLIPFIPGAVWDRLRDRFWSDSRSEIRIFYDRDCGFCLRTCLLLRTFLMLPPVPIEPAQDDPEMGELLEREQSWIVLDPQGNTLLKWQAVAYLFTLSPLFWPLGRLLASASLAGVGRAFYDMIGRNRGPLGRALAPLMPLRPFRFRNWKVVEALVLLLLVHAFVVNAFTYHKIRDYYPTWMMAFDKVTRLEQRWSMFAPRPLVDDGWFVMPGQLTDGRKVDVYNMVERPVTFDKPDPVYGTYDNQQWRRYVGRLADTRFGRLRFYFGYWICRQWNGDPNRSTDLQAMEMYYMLEKTPPPGGETTVKPIRLMQYNCPATTLGLRSR